MDTLAFDNDDGNTDDKPAPVETADHEIDTELRRSIPQAFCIDTEERANWFVRRVMETRAYGERVKQWALAERRRAAREERTLMFLYGGQLEAWAKAEIQARFKGRRRSLPLPAGTVGHRAVAPKLVIDDETAVLSWAREHCQQAIIVVEKLAKSVLQEHFDETGELPVIGVHMEAAGDRFYIG